MNSATVFMDVISKIDRLMSRADRKAALRWELSADRDAALAMAGVSQDELQASIANIRTLSEISRDDSDSFFSFAEFLRQYMLDYETAIDIYLKIVRAKPFVPEVYRNLLDIYHYSYERLQKFDFIGNALREPDDDAIDPIFICMSYTYMGRVLERLGRFSEAWKAYQLTHIFRNDPRNYAKAAAYAEQEMAFLAECCQFKEEAFSSESSKPPLFLCSVFFGSNYRLLFENAAGATFFNPATLDAIRQRWTPVLLLFCPLSERIEFMASDLFRYISTQLPVRIVSLPYELIESYPDPAPAGQKYHPAMPYSVSGLAQICATEIARRHNADLISIPPDAIFAAETGAIIRRHADGGAQVLFATGIRLNRERVFKRLQERRSKTKSQTLDIPVAELSELALRNLHTSTLACIVEREKITYPGMLWWRAGDDALVGHCFQMHPIYVAAAGLRRSFMRRFDSIDGDFVHSMYPEEGSWHHVRVACAADEAMMFELTSESFEVPRLFEPADLPGPASSWVTSFMRPINFWLFGQQVHIGKPKTGVKNGVDRKVAEVVEKFEQLRPFVKTAPTKPVTGTINESPQVSLLVESVRADSKERADAGLSLQATKNWQDLRIVFAVAVWNERYICNFLSLSLPSLLAPGNLGSYANVRNALFIIHTREEDRSVFDRSPYFQALTRLMRVEFRYLQSATFFDAQKYEILNGAQSEAIQLSKGFDGIIFLYADFVWGDGVIQAALKRLAEGCDAAVMPVPPLILEDFLAQLDREVDQYFRADGDGACLQISSRELVRLGKATLHPMMRDNAIGLSRNTSNPAYVLWLGPNGDYLIRCFHIHPLILRVQDENPDFWRLFDGTLDESFFPRILKAFDRVVLIQDSDEAAVVSLTGREFPLGYLPDGHKLDVEKVALWAETHAAPLHKRIFDGYSIWHSEDINLDQWAPTIERSQLFSDSVKMLISMPDAVTRSEVPMNWLARSSRVSRFVSPEARDNALPAAPSIETVTNNVVDTLPPGILFAEMLARAAALIPRDVRRSVLRLIPATWVMKVKNARRISSAMLRDKDPRLAIFDVLMHLPFKDLVAALMRCAVRAR